ncbi:hypothetical protein HID58_037375 [Brassica napus]|uniref:SAC domain-containing protein n=1 Tax=Brassica napus TaxID=3708 RepID=A0ABQ8BL56_BRANA|nr:hypothetical protein HID58_037375 [Brassica napus]
MKRFIQQKLGSPSVSDYKKLQSEKSDLQIKDNENFYMIGWNGNGVYRVLKIDQLDASELNLSEDFTAYTKKECNELLKRIHKENKATGGLKFVTLCYGIIGFIKFLGPYYMLRREIGQICGHRVYEVSKSEIISLRNSSVICNISNSRDENRMIHPGKGLPSEILSDIEDERCFFQVDLQVKTRLGVETRGTEADSSIQ